MPGPNMLPGAQGKDYRFVKAPNGKVYVVYRVKLPNGSYTNISYLVPKADFKAFGVDPAKLGRVTGAQFRKLNFFGNASEIVMRGKGGGVHPFQQFVKSLHEQYQGASWLQDKEFMSVMLMGEAENWSAAELENATKQTKWYQSRTDAQRRWELDTAKADRVATIKSTRSQIADALSEIYGEGMSWDEQYSSEKLDTIAKNIASGKWGEPSEGFNLWFAGATNRAEKIEGTAAWIQAQQELEAQRAFMNRPEDIREQIRTEAFEWLGPRGAPDEDTLVRWSQDLASEIKSDGDWQSFLQTQAKNLYPWLGDQERWMDRAGSYKKILEEQWGTSIDWNEGLLGGIGEKNETTGEFTGAALSYDNFQRLARQDDRFWQSNLGRQEGFELFGALQDTFQGVR